MIPLEPSSLSLDSRAAYAIWSRLLSCLVTEALLRAFYLPFPPNDRTPAVGIMVVLSTNLISEQPSICRALVASDIYAIVPLYREPVLRPSLPQRHGSPVALVDPLDMLPEVYELIEHAGPVSSSIFSLQQFQVLNWKLDSRKRVPWPRIFCSCASALEA